MTIRAYKKSDGRIILEVKDNFDTLIIPENCELSFQNLTLKNKNKEEDLIENE